MPEAERRLSERFGLNWDVQMQDWDLNNANANLLPRFLNILSEPTLSDDELYALMGVTIASVDEALQLGIDGKIIEAYLSSLEYLLLQRPYLYVSAVLYWAEPALLNLEDDEQFPISKHMARFWVQILPRLDTGNLGQQIPPPEK
ncbi:hypothetical protein [Pseudoduganella namucuonensis]|uniref:hypothetical protein n=1 Tax=Pseudoduganella namucuonensis TaxID=1035707 RepID=UPI001160B5DF|nr:hypothetical protein [Pseudoduganella namucuonensis]